MAGEEKAGNIAKHQDWRTVNNALVLCLLGNSPADTVLDLVNSACNLDLSLDDLLRCGERAWNLKRVINNRLGLTRKNDKLPKSFMQPLADGGAAGFVPDFDAMLEAYYLARGWNPSTGAPTQEKLTSLGLGWTI